MLPLVFPESHTKDSRGLFLQESAGWSDPGLVGTPGRSCRLPRAGAWGASVCLRGQHAAPPAPGTKDASGQKGSLSSPSDEGLFSPDSSCCRGEGGVLFIPVQLGLWNCRFPRIVSGAGVPLSLPSSEALLPTLPARRQPPPPPPVPPGPFYKAPQQAGFFLGKEAGRMSGLVSEQDPALRRSGHRPREMLRAGVGRSARRAALVLCPPSRRLVLVAVPRGAEPCAIRT